MRRNARLRAVLGSVLVVAIMASLFATVPAVMAEGKEKTGEIRASSPASVLTNGILTLTVEDNTLVTNLV